MDKESSEQSKLKEKVAVKAGDIFIEEFTVSPTGAGSLEGLTFAVKDVFDVSGVKTGFGNRLWDSQQSKASSHAHCLTLLLGAGATCRGKTTLGEFCCGIEGKNPEYGMPINPANPELVPGGSSSGSAAAVALGEVDFALGTDMGGSVRVPANNCGVFGIRPTHGRIAMSGCLSLSESLDTIGVFSRSIQVLKRVMQVLLSSAKTTELTLSITTLLLFDDLLDASTPEIQDATLAFAERFATRHGLEIKHLSLDSLNNADMSIADVMRYLICSEIWKNIGAWVEENHLEYGTTTHVDFSFMRSVDEVLLEAARARQESYIKQFDELLQHAVVCVPTMPIPPRRRDEVLTKTVNDFDYKRVRAFIALSSVCKLPQVTIPVVQSPIPIGVSLLGRRGTDLSLLDQAEAAFSLT